MSEFLFEEQNSASSVPSEDIQQEEITAAPESVQPEEIPVEKAPAEELPAAEPAAEEVPAEEPTEESPKYRDASLADYLEMTIQSCVLPLEMRFSQINGCYRRYPRAYRSYTFINSVIEGVIPPEKYSFAADQTERGIRLTKWNIKEAATAIDEFMQAGRHIEFVTARVSPQIVREVDFFDYIKTILDECELVDYGKLCLEFPKTVLFEDREAVRTAILSLKLLKVRSAISGFGDRDSAITPLFELPFDYVILAPWLIENVNDRNKELPFENLLGFIHGLGAGVIVDGIKSDDQLTILSRYDTFGYIPSPAYKGEVEHGRLRMPLDEAKLQEEEAEY
ncbi:MAG: EAL domain-containing protein [Clostridia bacterium]|nr:EAL domain-containing protein [Clostridia bacterium]